MSLHYTYSNLDEEILEKLSATAGKPLVSKLNLYEPRPSQCARNSSAGIDSFNGPESSLYASGGLDAWPSHLQSDSEGSSANVPQETDCDELYDAPQPLVADETL